MACALLICSMEVPVSGVQGPHVRLSARNHTLGTEGHLLIQWPDENGGIVSK